MMSLAVLVGTLSPLPPASLSPPASLYLSIAVVIGSKPWEWQEGVETEEEERGGGRQEV